jgi:thiol-disulfide isomerase/thioredoxin
MEAFEDSLGTLFHLNPFFVEYLGAAPNPDSTLTARLMLSQACIRYTRAYCNRHQLGDWFFEREKTRIQANFLFTLYNFHMHHPSEFRKYFARNEGLLDTAVISRYKLDEQAFAQDILFHGAAEAYALSDYFYHYPDVVNDTLKFLQKYQHYKSLYPKNNAIKAYLLADLLYAYSKFNYPQADSLARDFASLYPGSADAQRVDSITAFYRSSYLNMDSVVALPELVDKRGQRTSLTEVVRQAHRPVFIDCWATWCIPCMKEMAYSHELEMRYGDSVVFIYLSMDHHPEDWIRHLDKNHLEKGQYRLEGDSHSALAKTFAIHSIPRYLLYDGNGKLVTMFSPRPSDSRIGPLLDKLIR